MNYFLSMLAVVIATVSLSACDKAPENRVSTATQPAITELIVRDTLVGTGAAAEKNKQLTVHYTGWLYDASAKNLHGKQFDSSRGDDNNKARPFCFYLGAGQVIPGWDQGIDGMKVGGRRTLTIPSELAYGKRGAGRGLVPADAPLIFEIELLAVK